MAFFFPPFPPFVPLPPTHIHSSTNLRFPAASSRSKTRHSSEAFKMRARPQPQPSNQSVPPYDPETLPETLPGYSLTDLNRPAKAHIYATHTEGAVSAPADDYVVVQPQLNFDAEANAARNNARTVSVAQFSCFHSNSFFFRTFFSQQTC